MRLSFDQTGKYQNFVSDDAVQHMERLADFSFTDIEYLGSEIGWDLDFRQLECGPLRARTEVFAGNVFTIMRVELDRRFHQVGGPIAGMKTFAVMDRGSEEIDWCRGRLRDYDLVDFNHPGGFDGVSMENHRGHTFSIEEDFLKRRALALGLDYEALSRPEVTGKIAQPSAAVAHMLRSRLTLLRSEFDRLDDRARGLLEDELAETLCSAVLLSANRADTSRHRLIDPNARQLICRRAVAYIDAHVHLPVKVSDVCLESGVSISTLERAFRAYLDITPKRYIMYRRLAAVARALDAHPELSVTEVAGRWGFWHMGQFARDFQRFNGYLPSLRRPARLV